MGQTIKVSTKAPIIIEPFHKDVFAIAQTGHKASETMAKKMENLLISKYGQPVVATADDGTEVRSGGPTFEQYRADRKALAKLAKDKGLADDQWVRKPFCAAVKALYGKLPEAQTPEAIRKQEERKAAKAAVEALRKARDQQKTTAGAPAGQTQDRAPTEQEQLESLITRIGLLRTGDALCNVLEADERTKPQAVHIRKMLAKVAQLISQQQSQTA